MKKGMNDADIKLTNRGLVLRQVATSRQASRISITNTIGLTKMTVSNIVSELIEKGYLTETRPAVTTGVGRVPMLLDIAADSPVAAGIYLSRDAVSGIVSDLKLRILYEESIPLREETAESLQEKLHLLTDHLLHCQERPLIGIGVSAIGLLDIKRGLLLNPKNFFGIRNFPIVRLLREQSGLPVTLCNDMNAAALAERLYGICRNRNDFIYLGISNGIGAGIMSGGQLLRADSNAVGEMGHLSIDPNGPECSCGRRGCLEVYASIPVILSRLKKACGLETLRADQFDEISADWRADAVFEDVILKLACALTDMINLLDMETVVVGHEGSYLPRRYLKTLEEEIGVHIFSAGYKNIEVLPSAFGIRAPLFGSVCCLFNALFSGKLAEGFSY